MANGNVRFYKLATLPSFDENKKGIFVHVTKTMYKDKWTLTLPDGKIEKDPTTIYMTPEKVGESVERINLVKWLSTRQIEEIASGLWFGGENGWELLSNETNSGAINDAIKAKIDILNAGGFIQATIGANPEGSESATGSTLTILGIKETKGIIEQDNTKNVNIAIDGVYNETDNKIATQDTVTNAIGALDSEGTIQAVTTASAQGNAANTVLTFNGIKEVDGKIAQGDGATTFTVGDAKLKIQIGSAEAGAFEVFSANKQIDSTIQLDGLVFKKDDNNVISVITKTAVSSSNKLVTEKDVANLAGAMHYRGPILNADAWPATVAAGDVYIATGNFEKDGNTIESGDLIVFNSVNLTDYKVVQSNITLGTGIGQVAANTESLTEDNIVVATNTGIKTIGISVDNLTDTTTNNKRTLTIGNSGDADGALYHAVTITDDFTVIGKPFTETINISSTNRSIEIAKNGETGVVVDLVWNTTMEQ